MESLNGLHILLPKVGAECPAGPVLSAGAQVVPCVRKLGADWLISGLIKGLSFYTNIRTIVWEERKSI